MKKFSSVILLSLFFVIVNGTSHHNNRYQVSVIKDVIVCDSQFVETLTSFISNDSVLETIRKYFIPDMDFKNYYEGPNFLRVEIDKRNTSADKYRLPFLKVFTELIDDSLKTILKQDDLLHVIINLSMYPSDDYKTTYNGWDLYFAERDTLNGQQLFKDTGQCEKITTSLDRICSGWIHDLWIPLIYHNNRLYIEPDSLQWFILRE